MGVRLRGDGTLALTSVYCFRNHNTTSDFSSPRGVESGSAGRCLRKLTAMPCCATLGRDVVNGDKWDVTFDDIKFLVFGLPLLEKEFGSGRDQTLETLDTVAGVWGYLFARMRERLPDRSHACAVGIPHAPGVGVSCLFVALVVAHNSQIPAARARSGGSQAERSSTNGGSWDLKYADETLRILYAYGTVSLVVHAPLRASLPLRFLRTGTAPRCISSSLI